MSNVQTIIKNRSAVGNFTTDSYKTERKDTWSLDVLMDVPADSDLIITMQVSWDNFNWKDHAKLRNEKVDKIKGQSFMHDKLPFAYIRFVIVSSATIGEYTILFMEL